MTEEERDLINLKIAISPEKYIKELLQENQQLKDTIVKNNKIYLNSQKYVSEIEGKYVVAQYKLDKAIEYINGSYEMAYYTKSISLGQENIEELLEILKFGG